MKIRSVENRTRECRGKKKGGRNKIAARCNWFRGNVAWKSELTCFPSQCRALFSSGVHARHRRRRGGFDGVSLSCVTPRIKSRALTNNRGSDGKRRESRLLCSQPVRQSFLRVGQGSIAEPDQPGEPSARLTVPHARNRCVHATIFPGSRLRAYRRSHRISTPVSASIKSCVSQ